MPNGNNENLLDSVTTAIATKVNSLPIWKKQLQMILISLYISLSCIVTIINHTINFNTTMPLKIVDILVIIVLFILLFINLFFIYGCYTSNRILLYLTPAIPNFILIFVVFPQMHAFYYPLTLFLEYNGLGESGLYKLLKNLGSLTMIRVIYFIPFLLYSRFLYNAYTDDFIEELQNEKEMEREEAEEARLEAEKAEKLEAEKQEEHKDLVNEEVAAPVTASNEEPASEENHNAEEVDNTPVDPETKKNN